MIAEGENVRCEGSLYQDIAAMMAVATAQKRAP